jgi:hypothetical protein
LREKIPLAKVFADRLPVTALSILSAKLEQNKVIGAKPMDHCASRGVG